MIINKSKLKTFQSFSKRSFIKYLERQFKLNFIKLFKNSEIVYSFNWKVNLNYQITEVFSLINPTKYSPQSYQNKKWRSSQTNTKYCKKYNQIFHDYGYGTRTSEVLNWEQTQAINSYTNNVSNVQSMIQTYSPI